MVVVWVWVACARRRGDLGRPACIPRVVAAFCFVESFILGCGAGEVDADLFLRGEFAEQWFCFYSSFRGGGFVWQGVCAG